MSLGFHQIQVYVNQDYSDLDTTIIFNLYEDIATIMVEIYPLWDYEWVGSITVDNHNPFFPPSGEKTVPTTLGAKIEVSYSSYEDCGFCPPSNYILYFDQEEFSLIDCGSPCILEKGIELFEGQTGDVRVYVGCSSGDCMPNIVITSIILSTK